MNFRKLPALLLAAALQVLPMCRVACVNLAVAPTGFAIVMRWLAGAVALLGSYHAVSGASAAIVGVASWSKITNGIETGPVVSSVTASSGTPLLYKIIITTPATSGAQNDYYNYDTLPPGLTIKTNVGGADGLGNGFITGTPSKGGVYTVNLVAGNTLWLQTVTKAITFTISGGGGATPPAITSQPLSKSVAAGTNVSFSVTATGTAPLSYQWSKGVSAILGATNSSYSIAAVTTNDAGNYKVVITNSAGSITSAVATLTVLVPPSILTPPQSQTVSNGANATFTIAAGGSAPLTYLWKFNGGPLASATSSSLTITNVQSGNQGDYTVVVSNSVGTVTSSVAHLMVQTAAPGPFQLANWQVATSSVSFDITSPNQTNVVVWSSPDLAHWTALTTNFSTTGTVHFSETNGQGTIEFYRATLTP
jgi:hypothetical protein